MITLPSVRDTEEVLAAITEAQDPASGGYAARLGIYADGEPITGDVREASWGQSQIPITLLASVRGQLSHRMADAPVYVVAEIEGKPIPQMRGKKTAVLPGDTAYSSDLISSTTGSLLAGDDAIKLVKPKDYPGVPPHNVAAEVASRLPYDPSQIEIQPVAGVSINWSGDGETPGFLAHERTGDVLSRLQASVGYRYRDTAHNGFVAWIPEPLASPQDGEHLRVYQSHQLPDWLEKRPTPPLVRYAAVRAYHLDEDGDLAWEVVVDVPYGPGSSARDPHPGRILDVPFDDASATGEANAAVRVERLALDLARGISTGQMLLPNFDPLVETNDPMRVNEDRRATDGLYELVWGMRVENYKHLYASAEGSSSAGSKLISTLVGYTATLLHEEKIRTPDLVVPAGSWGIVPTPPTPPPPSGVVGDELYFLDTATGVQASGDELIFQDTGPFTVVGDELVVSE